jgi:hypothetical protein
VLCLARPCRWLAAVALLALTACAVDDPEAPAQPPAPDAGTDRCGGKCSNVELCQADEQGTFGCARICANQFHCWSGCCLPAGDTGYNVCRATEICFPPN